jgi:hypothetical protein
VLRRQIPTGIGLCLCGGDWHRIIGLPVDDVGHAADEVMGFSESVERERGHGLNTDDVRFRWQAAQDGRASCLRPACWFGCQGSSRSWEPSLMEAIG